MCADAPDHRASTTTPFAVAAGFIARVRREWNVHAVPSCAYGVYGRMLGAHTSEDGDSR